ncbi:MAG: hypothetical protein ACYC1U_07420 [Candidatus Aquicultorales bacterium]
MMSADRSAGRPEKGDIRVAGPVGFWPVAGGGWPKKTKLFSSRIASRSIERHTDKK